MPWIDRYYAIRDRWLSSPKFQRWAAAFPLTRPTARRRARALFDLCAGFVYSQILYACVRLKLFELLALEPQTAAQISAALKLPQDSTNVCSRPRYHCNWWSGARPVASGWARWVRP